MKRWLLAVGFVLFGAAWAVAQNTGVNPTVGSVWTYLGATYGAGWAVPPSVGEAWVPSNAALGTLITAAPQVYRAGFYTAGDGGGMVYTHTVAPCSMAAGAGDNGAQVKSLDGGCWIADFNRHRATPPVWGAKGDATTDDTAAMQKAGDAMGVLGGTLYIDEHVYKIGAVNFSSGRLGIKGTTVPGWGDAGCNPGLLATSPNINLVTLAYPGSSIEGVCIQMAGAPGIATSGAAITLPYAGARTIDSVYIINPCIGIDEAGIYNRILNNRIEKVAGANCIGVRSGHTSTGGANTGTTIMATTVACLPANPGVGFRIEDSGGMYFGPANDNTECDIGTYIIPGANQRVMWGFFQGVLGDTSRTNDLRIDTGANTAGIAGLSFVQTWAASGGAGTAGPSVGIFDSFGPTTTTVEGISFIGHRTYVTSAATEAFLIYGGHNIKIIGSSICSSVEVHTAPLIRVGPVLKDVVIANNTLGACDHGSATNSTSTGGAVFIENGVDRITVTNNIFQNITNPSGFAIQWATTGNEDAVIHGNIGFSETPQVVFADPTTDVGFADVIVIQGAGTMTRITPTYSRDVTIVSFGTWHTAAGGNICSAPINAALNSVFHATYIKNTQCWYIK